MFCRKGLVWLKSVGFSRGWQPQTESQAMLLEANSLSELRWQRQCPLCQTWLPPGETEATVTHGRKGSGLQAVLFCLWIGIWGGMLGVWDIQCLGLIWDAPHLGFLVFVDALCSGCSVLELLSVWDAQNFRYFAFGMLNIQDTWHSGCSVFRMLGVWDAQCLGCLMFWMLSV